MGDTAGLIDRRANDEIAWLTDTLTVFNQPAGAVTAQQFLGHVQVVAELLPATRSHCINLCHNRYLFMVTFCAVLVRQQTNLLASNKNPVTQTRLHQRYADAYIVHNGLPEVAPNITAINLHELTLCTTTLASFSIPQIECDHIAAISFTSGSTGDAKAIIKTWQTFVASTKVNARYMLPNQTDTFFHLATVPSQHMWGLETTVLMALLANACLVDTQPFFPPDIASVLRKLPAPKALVTTPLHLRALNASAEADIHIDNILVATAPLSMELAGAAEKKFNTQVREVYGCSEVGSMSIRRAALTEQWLRFDALSFTAYADGNTIVSAPHLAQQVTLDDQITMLDHEHFLLAGRDTDQINIAGKRGSLLEVNNVLMKFEGLLDGVVFFPAQDRSVPRLVALVVLSENKSKQELRKHFSAFLDSAFVPRPILLVQQLPREENGKLIKSRLLELYQQLIQN